MRFPFVVLFLVVAAGAAEDPAADIRPPVIPDAAPDDGSESEDRAVIHLTKDGRVIFRGEQVSLDRLKERLGDARVGLYRRRIIGDRPGEIEVADGFKVSALYLFLKADADAPWRHVEWIQTIAAESSYLRFQFAALRGKKGEWGKVDVPLPEPVALYSSPEESSHDVAIEVQMVAGTPTGPLYRVGKEEFREVEAAKKHLAGLCDAARKRQPKLDRVICAVRASGKVPCKRVIELAALFRKQGMKHVHLYSTDSVANPSKTVRGASRLPHPKGDQLPSAVIGSGSVGPSDD